MKTIELKQLSAEELSAKIRDERAELNALRLKHASKAEVEKPAQMRKLRREIARMLTIQNAAKKEAK